MANLLGKTIGKYQIIEFLARGDSSVVYKGFHPEMNRYVAVKILSPSAARSQPAVDEFLKAGAMMSQLDHPNILPVYDYGEQEGVYYIVSRFVEGGPLSNRIQFFNTPQNILQLFGPVTGALDYVHKREIVHGNLKPANILISSGDQPLLADFGFSQRMIQTDTPGDALMSPEQAQGGAFDGRADVYALGAILYEILVGEEPPIGSIPSPRLKRPELPESLEKVILKAMAQYPEQRFQTAGEFYQAISAALKPKPVPPPVTTTQMPVPSTPSETLVYPAPEPIESQDRSWLRFALGGLVLLIIICAVGAFFIFVVRENRTSAAPTVEAARPRVTALVDTPIRNGPGEAFEQIGILVQGQTAEVNAITADGLWYGIFWQGAENDRSWVSSAQVAAENIQDMPVIQPPTLPTDVPTEIPPTPIPPTPTLPPEAVQPIEPTPTTEAVQPIAPTFPPEAVQPVAPTPTIPDSGGGTVCGLAGLPAVLLLVGLVLPARRRWLKRDR